MGETAFDAAFLRRLERLAIVARRTLKGVGRGERRSHRRGGTVEFADYRSYVRGDDTRAIDWAAYARLEQLFVKLFVEEQDLTLHLLLDRSASMEAGDPSKLLWAKRALGALAYVGLASGDRVTVSAFAGGERGPELEPLRGRSRFPRVLRFLDDDVAAGGTTSLSAMARAFVARRATGGVVVLATDLLDPAGHEEALDRLRHAGHEPFVLHVLAPDEASPEVGPDAELEDLETLARVAVSLDGAAVAAYRERFARWTAAIEAFAAARRIGYARVVSDVPFEEGVLALLARRSLVA